MRLFCGSSDLLLFCKKLKEIFSFTNLSTFFIIIRTRYLETEGLEFEN